MTSGGRSSRDHEDDLTLAEMREMRDIYLVALEAHERLSLSTWKKVAIGLLLTAGLVWSIWIQIGGSTTTGVCV